MSQEEKKQTAPETEAAAEKPETPAQEAPEKEAPQAEEKNEGKHDCKHHHHETAALQAKLEAEEKKNADLKNQLLRTAAEYDNYRRRTQKERENVYPDAVANTLKELLPLLDNLQRALDTPCADENYLTGIKMIQTGFEEYLKKMGVETFGKAGEPFDPNLHNAVMHIEDDAYGEGVVVEEFEKGFCIGDRVLRYSVVKVAN